MHDQTFQSVLDNYKELMELWEWSLSVVRGTEIKARIRGVQSFMEKFGFLFGCHLGKTSVVSNRQSFKNNPKI